MDVKFIKKVIENNIPRWIVLLIDVYIVVNSFVLSHFIYSNMSLHFDVQKVMWQIPMVIFASGISFLSVRLYKGIIRHLGNKDLENIFKSSLSIFLLLLGTVITLNYLEVLPILEIPISVLSIHLLLNIILLATARYIFKYLYIRFIGEHKTNNIAIYGAGDAGILTSAIYNNNNNNNNNNNKVVAFIDDDKRKVGNKINGVPIYHSSEIDEYFVITNRVKEVIISVQTISSNKMLDITDKFGKLGVKVRVVPPVENWMNGTLQNKQIQEVKIEDLLGRQAIKFKNPTLAKEFKDKTILVTGAAGSIGSEIARQVARYEYKKLVLLDIGESPLYNLQQYFVRKGTENIEFIVSDVRNKERMEFLFKTFPPDIVFHASAYKHVPFMEENPFEAVHINVGGTKIMADLAVKYKADKFVMISTDKAVNPTNVMGATKRLAELYVSSLKDEGTTKFITTRFGNVLGSNGSVIPVFKAQIKEGGPLTVTHKDITRFFMTIPEACRLVLEAGAMGHGGEIFVFDMGESVKIFDLAQKMIRLSGLKYPEDIDIKIVGLRPGEKIYEEVLSTEENTLPTYHERIKIAKVRDINKEEIKEQILQLCEVNSTMDKMKIVRKMKEIVPEFLSNNSEFSVLDK
ncbi:MAG: polysaccharide biosynthesis protein [Flavobacteriaceae bacterium]|nr:polysaccharide biosynthesis protein [Flavobacteriaceae bacterium]